MGGLSPGVWRMTLVSAGWLVWQEARLAGCLSMGGQVIAVLVDGVEVLVETARVAGTEPTSIGNRAQQQLTDAFERAQDTIVALSAKVKGTARQLAERGARPDKIEVEFGLKFTAKGDVIVASGSGEVALKVIVGYDPRRVAANKDTRRAGDDDEAGDDTDEVP